MFSTLRFKVFVWFSLFSLLMIFFIIANYYYIKQKEKIWYFDHLVQKNQILLLKDRETQNYLFTQEIKTPEFYDQKNNRYLERHKRYSTELLASLDELKNSELISQFHLEYLLDTLIQIKNRENILINTLVPIIRTIGNSSQGLQGQMNYYAYKLEHQPNIDLNLWSILRNDENCLIKGCKDLIIKDHENKLSELRNAIRQNNEINELQRNINEDWLKQYENLFIKTLELEKELYINTPQGIVLTLAATELKLEKNFQTILQHAELQKINLTGEMRYIYILFSLILIGLTLIASFLVSIHLSRPVIKLNRAIRNFVQSKFSEHQDIIIRDSHDEISELSGNFFILQKEIGDYINFFVQKVEERTHEISNQKQHIENQKEEIESQLELLEVKNQDIEIQKQIAENHNRNILASIRYAQRIQEALLPDENQLQKVFPNSFLYQKPKDIVSGDFLFISRIRKGDRDETIIAVADCTGHGVPGAVMSFLCFNFLNQIIHIYGHTNPLYVLTALNKLIYEALNAKDKKKGLTDGLDIAFCKIDNKTRILEYSGAHNPLYLIRKDKLHEVKGQCIFIGKDPDLKSNLKKDQLQLEQDDLIYLFSDGFADQFGGPDIGKYYYKRFKQLILNISQSPLSDQKTKIEEEYQSWVFNQTQTDDIIITGIKIE